MNDVNVLYREDRQYILCYFPCSGFAIRARGNKLCLLFSLTLEVSSKH